MDNEDGLLDIFYKLVSFDPFRGHLEADLQDHVLESRAARNLSEISRLLSRFSHLHGMHSITPVNRIALPEELFNEFFRYLYIDGIGEYEDDSEYAPKGCISFMTIHQSKGLEFPVVIVGSLGNSPRKNHDFLMTSLENRFFHRPPFEPAGRYMTDVRCSTSFTRSSDSHRTECSIRQSALWCTRLWRT